MHTKSSIQNLLARNDKAVEKALIVLYKRQTRDERLDRQSRHDNMRGFNQADAGWLSKIVQEVLLAGHSLSANHMIVARQRVMKYWRQLLEEAEAKQARLEGGVR